MHVLPLPFGLALALLPRREATLISKSKAPISVYRGPGDRSHRDRVLGEIHYANVRHII
jgi:hypothetical protein